MKVQDIKVGREVWYHPVIGGETRKPAVITSEPYEMCGTICCMVDSVSGCVAIEALEPR